MSISNCDQGKTINIYEDGIGVGTGVIGYTANGGGAYFVEDCPAILGANSAESDEAYEAIDVALNSGAESVVYGYCRYTWEFTE